MCIHPNVYGQGEGGDYNGECGVAGITRNNGRVVNGSDAAAGQWPWQALIHVKTKHQPLYCGGILIRPTWILTAAHCLQTEDTIESIIIILGANNQTNSDEIGRQYLNVEEHFLHQDYGDVIGSFIADIALLQLTTEVTYDYYVRPACLPTFGSEATVGQTCFVSGFGDTQDTGNQNILQYAGVDIISRETCNEWYSTLNLSIPSDHFCAGFEEGGIDTCQGDSGGPLVCMESSVYVARGITSFGEGCAVAQRPGAYTDVVTYMNWIIEKIDEKEKTTGAYTEYASTRIATSESTTSHAVKLKSNAVFICILFFTFIASLVST
uniref:plasminogen-like n=1 Tax=Styela clava TaxID=7725 RepID=UPI00193AA4A8|nr:plasminogen-like [Styela clava]